MEHLIEWLKYQVEVAKYVRDYAKWLKSQEGATTQDDGGSNPPTPPPKPPGA